MKLPKNLHKSILAISALSIIWLTSCGDDSDEPTTDDDSTALNEGSFNGNSFAIDGGDVYEYGAVNFVDEGDPTHYNYDFVIYDGTVNRQTDTFSGTFVLYAELLSPGTASFLPGTFNFIEDASLPDVADKYYFDYIEVVYDGNNNNSIEDAEDLFYGATGGSIMVVDNGGNNYTLTYDLNLIQVNQETGVPLAGSETTIEFSTTLDFEYYDERDVEPAAARRSSFFRNIKNK